MCKSILVALIFLASSAWAAPQWNGGLGFELRMQREVNPSYPETKGVPGLFVRAQWTHWAAQLEGGYEASKSESGALSISSKTYSASVWGRYVFLEEKPWRPFVAAGVGTYCDKVTSEFATSANENTGWRPFTGIGGGVSKVSWGHFLTEAEGRVSFVRERKEPLAAALFRIGFSF